MPTELREKELEESARRMAEVQARRIVDLMPVADILRSEWRSVMDIERDYRCSWDAARRVVALLREKRAEMKECRHGI